MTLLPSRSYLFALAALAGSTAAQSIESRTPIQGVRSAPVERVAYVSDEAVNDVFEVFAAPTDGSGAPVRLSAAFPVGGDADPFFQVAGDRVVYRADQDTNEVVELFSVRSDGSEAPVKLNGPLVAGGDVEFVFHAGRERVVYVADAAVDDQYRLYSVPVDGSAPPIELAPGLDIYHLGVGPMTHDGSLIVLVVNHAEGAKQLMYAVATDGSAAPLLLGESGDPMVEWAYTGYADVLFSRNGRYAVYIAVHDDDEEMSMNLYAVPLDGSTPPVRLNQTPDFPYSDFFQFRFGPMGRRVFFTEPSGGFTRLHSIRLDGTGFADISRDAGHVDAMGFRLSAGHASVVFSAHASPSSGPYVLLAAPLDGSAPPEPIQAPIADRILTIDVTPDGYVLVYATWNTANTTRLFSLKDAFDPRSLVGDPPPKQGVEYGRRSFDPVGRGSILITPDGKRVVFRGDLGIDERYGVYSVPIDGSAPFQELNEPLAPADDVWSFGFAAGGRRLVYRLDRNSVSELFSVPVDGSSAPLRLNQPPVTGGDVGTYLLVEPGGRIASRF